MKMFICKGYNKASLNFINYNMFSMMQKIKLMPKNIVFLTANEKKNPKFYLKK